MKRGVAIMRRIVGLVALMLSSCSPSGERPDGIDWQLLAIDGVMVEPATTAIFRIEADGSISGKGPCNSYRAQNTATLPDFRLDRLQATRAACERLADEQLFFTKLAQMQAATPENALSARADAVVLRAEDGNSLEFVRERMNTLLDCKTRPKK